MCVLSLRCLAMEAGDKEEIISKKGGSCEPCTSLEGINNHHHLPRTPSYCTYSFYHNLIFSNAWPAFN